MGSAEDAAALHLYDAVGDVRSGKLVTPAVYTQVNKNPTANGRDATDQYDVSNDVMVKQQQLKKQKKDQKAGALAPSSYGYETAGEIANNSLVSLYPPGSLQLHPVAVYTDAGSADDMSRAARTGGRSREAETSLTDSANQLTLIDAAVYGNGGYADSQRRPNDQIAPVGGSNRQLATSLTDSANQLTLIDAAVYGSGSYADSQRRPNDQIAPVGGSNRQLATSLTDSANQLTLIDAAVYGSGYANV
jgi:hypothetical protein